MSSEGIIEGIEACEHPFFLGFQFHPEWLAAKDRLDLLEKENQLPGINQLRIGEALLLGTDATNSKYVPGTRQSTMRLITEVIEAKIKPSYPIGKIGRDAFGNIPKFENKGLMKRTIVAIGRQDCLIDGLKPVDHSISILGASSDHLMLDVTHSQEICVGSKVEFEISYSAMLSLMTSRYVEKKVLDPAFAQRSGVIL